MKIIAIKQDNVYQNYNIGGVFYLKQKNVNGYKNKILISATKKGKMLEGDLRDFRKYGLKEKIYTFLG